MDDITDEKLDEILGAILYESAAWLAYHPRKISMRNILKYALLDEREKAIAIGFSAGYEYGEVSKNG